MEHNEKNSFFFILLFTNKRDLYETFFFFLYNNLKVRVDNEIQKSDSLHHFVFFNIKIR